MHPAPSIILFTTASGAGYGLLFWLGLLRPWGLAGGAGAAALLCALALISLGLLASLGHLGRPERAWRALSQWRSSWLSREGVAALVTFLPAGGLLIALWTGREAAAALLGALAAAGAVATVWSTGMIYAALKPIRQWHHPLVAPGYLLFAGFSGAVLLAALSGAAPLPALLAALLAAAALLLKRRYWAAMDAPGPRPSIEAATGLGRIGPTRPLDPPHTQQTWLLREMGYRVARRHRARLRRLALGGFATAGLLALAAAAAGGWAGTALLALAVPVALAALAAERWLMFAEATHTVTLFYGPPPAGERLDAPR